MVKIKTPLTKDVIKTLKAGDEVFLSGTIFTARDAAHKRLVDLIKRGKHIPLNLKDAVIYYAGPTPTPPKRAIGSCGPTTSSRMEDRKSTRLNSSHSSISYAVFCLI